jgi:hypothetical protein
MKFEYSLYSKVKESDISELELIADVVSGAYGKAFFHNNYINEYGTKPTVVKRTSINNSRA